MPAKPTIYWDACIFLAWLHDEAVVHGPNVLDGIEQMVRDVNDGKIVLFTSVMTKTEVLEYRLTKKAADTFANVFKRRNVSMVAQDERVADRSHEIRNYYAQRDIKLSSTDCVHLATAILYEAEAFYTLDGGGKRVRPNDLLPLNGNVAGYPLVIQKPFTAQGGLFTGDRAAASFLEPRQPKKFKTISDGRRRCPSKC
jgi:predicted nucleic acid-binding protein